MAHLCRLTYLLMVALASCYLVGDRIRAVQLAAMFLFIILPLAAVTSAVLSKVREIPASLRACMSWTIAIVFVTPLYYLRRRIPLPPIYADAVLMSILVGLALGVRGPVRIARDAGEAAFHPAAAILFVVLPILTCLMWSGFEARDAEFVRYCGLESIEYAKSASSAALVKVSPNLPLPPDAGGEGIVQPWTYFANAAWASELLGRDSRVALMLVAFNVLAVALLTVTVCAVISECNTSNSYISVLLGIGIVFLAPFINLRITLTPILPPIMQALSGGRTALAIAMALLACALVRSWNRKGDWRTGMLLSALCILTAGYNGSIATAVGLAIVISLLLGRVAWPLRFLVVALPVCLAGLLLLGSLQLVAFEQIARSLHFDGGFVLQISCGSAPLYVLWMIGRNPTRNSIYALLVFSSIAVSLFQPDDALAALLAIAAAPFVVAGVSCVIEACRRRRQRALIMGAAVCAAAAVVSTIVESSRLMSGRTSGNAIVELPREYVDAMEIIRRATSRDAIVIDSVQRAFTRITPALLLGERRIWLNDRRIVEFDAWRCNGYADDQTAAYLAAAADALVAGPGDPTPPPPWTLLERAGDYSVYISQLRKSARSDRQPMP